MLAILTQQHETKRSKFIFGEVNLLEVKESVGILNKLGKAFISNEIKS